MSETDANISYELTFLLCGLAAFVYVALIKKEKLYPRRERAKLAAAVCETAGQFTYVYAMSDRAVLAAPMIAAYSVMSVILSHIFLKERLKPRYYPVIAAVAAGVVILGFFE